MPPIDDEKKAARNTKKEKARERRQKAAKTVRKKNVPKHLETVIRDGMKLTMYYTDDTMDEKTFATEAEIADYYKSVGFCAE